MDLTRLTALVALMLALSGCLTDDGTIDGAADGTGDGDSEPVAPVLTDYSCHVDAGGEVVSLSGPAGNVGGCVLTTTSTDSTLDAVDAPDGCTIEYNDGQDNINDGTVAVGDSVPSGYTLSAVCGAGVVDADITITLAH